MSKDRKRPGVAFWATVVLVVALVGYPLSFGPSCWLAVRLERDNEKSFLRVTAKIYRPILLMWTRGPDWLAHWICEYAHLCTGTRGLYVDPKSGSWIDELTSPSR